MKNPPALPRPLALALGMLLAASGLAQAQASEHNRAFARTVFFGDSLTDAGYFRPLLPLQAQPVTGQFTTNPGLVWSQYLANYYAADKGTAWLATGAQPRDDSGDNYAAGGARVAEDVNGPLGYVPSLKSQVSHYLARHQGRADAGALYTVWGGANDLFAVAAGADAASTVATAVGEQVALVGQLQAAGAQYVLVPAIPDLGVTPAFLAQGPQAAAQATALASHYNAALFGALASRNLRVIALDTFNLLREVTQSPASYGFSNATSTACLPAITAQSLLCSPTSYASPDAPSTYVFADGVHPGNAAHAILADYATATLEAPRQIATLPHAAALLGRQRVAALGSQLAARDEGEGWRGWAMLRHDGQTLEAGHAGDGVEGGGVSADLGLDTRRGNWQYGLALGLARQTPEFAARRGDYRHREVALTALARWQGEAAWGSAQLGHARLTMDVRRAVPLGPALRQHEGRTEGHNSFAAVAAGWDFRHGAFTHGPVLQVLAQRIRLDGFAESGAGQSTALAFPRQQRDALHAAAGWQASMALTDTTRPFVRLMLEREYGDTPEQAFAQVTSIDTQPLYAVPAPKWDTRWGSVGAGVHTRLHGLDVNAGVSLSLGQEAQRQHSVYLGVARQF